MADGGRTFHLKHDDGEENSPQAGSPHEPGPAQGFRLLKASFSLPPFLLGGSGPGFCQAPGDHFDWNSHWMNQVEWN